MQRRRLIAEERPGQFGRAFSRFGLPSRLVSKAAFYRVLVLGRMSVEAVFVRHRREPRHPSPVRDPVNLRNLRNVADAARGLDRSPAPRRPRNLRNRRDPTISLSVLSQCTEWLSSRG